MSEDHDDRDELLKILESHGQQFLDSFATSSTKKRKQEDLPTRPGKTKSQKLENRDDSDFEAWDGFVAEDESDSPDSEQEESGLSPKQLLFLRTNSSKEISDDEFTAETLTAGPSVIVFTDPKLKTSGTVKTDKSQMKALMVSFT